ncbi:MAG: DMT family transporter [Chitinophagales bacterium]|nr:DMT family transporter [Chitinophagales bacterium]
MQLISGIPIPVRHILISTLSFAIMNVLLKKVTHLPAMEIVMFRCGVSMLLCFAALSNTGVSWIGNNRLLLLARGVFGTTALFTFFYTLDKMPLGSAVTIQYLSPIFTTVIAIFWLQEKVKSIQWLFFAISFLGVVVIKGFDSRIPTTALLVGIASAFASGMAYNVVRTLRGKENTMVVVLHFQLVGFVLGMLFTVFNWRTPTLIDLVYLFFIGVTTQIGQVNLTKALQGEKMANVSVYNYLGVLYAVLFGWLFFDESYSAMALSGIILVLSGVLLNYFYQQWQLRKLVPEETLSGVEE